MFLILARLPSVSRTFLNLMQRPTSPVLEPNLYRPLRHVDFVRNSLAYQRCRCRVLVELHFEGKELVLCGPLALLVLLLLREGALTRWSTRSIHAGGCAAWRRHRYLAVFLFYGRRRVFHGARLRMRPWQLRRRHYVGHVDDASLLRLCIVTIGNSFARIALPLNGGN